MEELSTLPHVTLCSEYSRGPDTFRAESWRSRHPCRGKSLPESNGMESEVKIETTRNPGEGSSITRRTASVYAFVDHQILAKYPARRC